MRVINVLLFPALVSLTACSHPKMCCGPAIQPGLIGNWSLNVIEAGLAGGIIVPPDSPVILTLNNDSTYQIQDRAIIVESGTFHLTDTPVAALSNITQPVIIFSAGVPRLFSNGPTVYTLSQDTLTLGTSVYDGPSAIYVKIE